MSAPSRTFITERQVCEIYVMSHRTVQRYLKDGLLKAYRVGPKMIRFDADEVERALIGDR
jgi:excisionase family DNA binding protein